MQNKTLPFWFTAIASILLSILMLCNSAKAEILASWSDERAYHPIPILFLHGFAEGGPTATWTEDEDHHPNIDLKLKQYFDKYSIKYADDPTILQDTRYPYLEVMNFIDFTQDVSSQFIDRNSSVDTYQLGDYYVEDGYNGVKRNPGDPGWSDKLNNAVNSVLNGYGTDKVILVCHSMGGLAAREYFRSFNGGNNALRLITIATPHLGSVWGVSSRLIIRTQGIGWFLPFMCWRFSPSIVFVDFALEQKRLIDMDGDAVRDMAPASDFLTTLNNSPQPQDVDYFAIYGDVLWFSGDGLVSLNSAQGQGVLTLKDKVMVYASHGNVPIIASAGAPSPLLKFIDYTKPVVEITSPNPNAGYIPEINSLSFNVRGTVSQEYLPADSILRIEMQGEGATQLLREGYLQPSDLWNPADENSVVAEFDEEITVLEPGTYTILVTVTNPAGFVSEAYTAWIKLTDIPGTGGDWRYILTFLNQKRSDVEKAPITVLHPEEIDMDGVFTIRQGTIDILADYGFTGLADALNCAGYAQATWSEGFACKNEIRDILSLMKIAEITFADLTHLDKWVRNINGYIGIWESPPYALEAYLANWEGNVWFPLDAPYEFHYIYAELTITCQKIEDYLGGKINKDKIEIKHHFPFEGRLYTEEDYYPLPPYLLLYEGNRNRTHYHPGSEDLLNYFNFKEMAVNGGSYILTYPPNWCGTARGAYGVAPSCYGNLYLNYIDIKCPYHICKK